MCSAVTAQHTDTYTCIDRGPQMHSPTRIYARAWRKRPNRRRSTRTATEVVLRAGTPAGCTRQRVANARATDGSQCVESMREVRCHLFARLSSEFIDEGRMTRARPAHSELSHVTSAGSKKEHFFLRIGDLEISEIVRVRPF